MGVFVEPSQSSRESTSASSAGAGATEGGSSRTRALGALQQALDSSPRVVAQAKQAQTLQRRASPRNDTGLPDSLKSGVESLSGMSLDDVRVHYNSSAPAQLQALAYTQGSDIHVAPGQEKHLAHEAWHVVQQKQGRVRPTAQLQGAALNDDSGLELEADAMSARASRLPAASSHAVATAQLNATPSTGAGASVPIQRVAVQLGADGAGNINNVNVGGRAGSLWPTERHHTTPWQTYLDTLDGALLGRTPDAAVARMNGLDNHLRNLPGWDLVDSLEGPKQAHLQAEIAELALRRATANGAAAGSAAQLFALQGYIQQWLTVRSKLPLSQANFGGGAVTVAADAGVARAGNLAGGGGVTDVELRAALLRLFDFGSVANLQTDEDGTEDPAEYRAFGLSRNDTAENLDELRELAFRQHARSIRRAYPQAFARLYANSQEMVDDMEARWADGDESEASEDSEMSDASDSD
ncbi:protein of unknown function [Myxococcus fulvus]|uniref:eCIS core domain-containing protein n=1 Tax=Myxococcus fulvus TaxID=33 RepID=A0A511T3B4_MYXFU|nr:DUF4157 domain-containing protein [Myxococcus fulvus]GEN08397.1 hypothetical protein MFU01_34340 [Myxococcus fulvus]SEU20737.1 protein of unknown function [Myxococcus fulvus]